MYRYTALKMVNFEVKKYCVLLSTNWKSYKQISIFHVFLRAPISTDPEAPQKGFLGTIFYEDLLVTHQAFIL
jgi:hypothetical protein